MYAVNLQHLLITVSFRFKATTRLPSRLGRAVPVVAILFGISCSEPEIPVATVAVGVNRAEVPLGGPIELSIRFVVSPRLEVLDEDYRVLLHFLDSEQDLMWADDHEPPVTTSSWQPGQVISYTRPSTIPMYPYIGEATIAIGLYSVSSGERLTLAAEDLGQRAYRGTTLNLEPQAESSFLLYEDGWHNDEFNNESNQQWRWTTERASLSFRNPRGDAILYLQLDGRPDLFPNGRQRIDIRVRGELLQEIVLESREQQFKEIELRAEQLGDGDTARIDLNISPTFVPSDVPSIDTTDDRRLGVRVYYAFLEPR